MAIVPEPKAAAGERCATAEAVPGCDAGPAGRAGFVLREIRVAAARRRVRRSAATGTAVRDGKGKLS